MAKSKSSYTYTYIILIALILFICINYNYYRLEGFNNGLIEIPFHIPRTDTSSSNNINGVPLIIYNSWHSNKVPPKMKENIDSVLLSNPEFDYYLYSDIASAEFIKTNFDINVLKAFIRLKPGAYKSDLWRYCILYKKGGVYIDIKYYTKEPLINTIKRSTTVYVNDRQITQNNITGCIYNGFMITPPGNPVLKECIDEIVNNCKNKLYKENSLDVTGTCLLGRILKKYDSNVIENNNYRFDDIDDGINYRRNMIFYKDTIILESYPEYRDEQQIFQKTAHYAHLWNIGDIFNL